MASRDLRPVGPVGALDRAIDLVRQGGARSLIRSWAGGAVIAVVCVLLFDAERIEGIRMLRPLFAIALTLAWWLRAWWLSEEAAARVRQLWPAAPQARERSAWAVGRTACVVGLGLWAWMWLPAGALLLSPFAVFFGVPFLAVRGAVAPSWLARAGCEEVGGVRAFLASVRDSDERRATGLLTELAVLLGGLGLFANLYAALLFVLLLGRSFLGIDLALADAFLSPSNSFVWLTMAALVLVLLEPLRPALSAVAYVDAQVRREGLDLRVMIDEVTDARARMEAERAKAYGRGPLSSGGAGLVALAFMAVLGAHPALAQDGVSSAQVAEETGDDRVREDVGAILSRPEFQELADHARGRGIRDLIEELFAWLFKHKDDEPEDPIARPSMGGPLPLPPLWFFLAAGALLLGAVLAYVVLAKPRLTRPTATEETSTVPADPRDRAPTEFLDDAALLAAQGHYREALRALYLATLVSLDRRRLIVFDPHHTNGHYLRQMPSGDSKRDFSEFTRRFDRAWYGGQVAGEEDYRACRSLADRVCAEPGIS